MKTRIFAIALGASAALAAGASAHAAGKIYVGGVLGLVNAQASGIYPDLDNAINLGAYGGYNLLGRNAHWNADLKGGTLAAEGQVTMTVAKGDAGNYGDWDMNSVAVYAAYRHPFTDYFYGKGKLGVARYDINVDNKSHTSDGIEAGLSIGLGAGFKVGPGNIEVEITNHNTDVLMVSGGFHISF